MAEQPRVHTISTAREAQLLEVAAHWALASRGGQEGDLAHRASMFIDRPPGGPPFLLGLYTSGEPPRGRSLSKDGAREDSAKK